MDIYVVLDGARVVGASARLQGAELIRADEARRMWRNPWAFAERGATTPPAEAQFYDRLSVVNVELRDLEG